MFKNTFLTVKSDPGKILGDVKPSSTVNLENKNLKETQCKKKSVSSKLINYLKIKETHGISL